MPPDLLVFLDFLIGNYDNIGKVFKIIDGEDGNGVISLTEFSEGLDEIKFTKLDGPDKKDRVVTLFRYMDPGGEGSVSEEEWQILGQLWSEYNLSIQEFVHFLQRTFGNDLHVAWEFLDEDGSGELTCDEFLAAVQEIGFFGPARCVFGLIDSSGDGEISYDEFAVLEAFRYKERRMSL